MILFATPAFAPRFNRWSRAEARDYPQLAPPSGTSVTESSSEIVGPVVGAELRQKAVLLTVLGLYLFGGEVLRGFGFTMVVGVVVGTYSPLFLGVRLVHWWSS